MLGGLWGRKRSQPGEGKGARSPAEVYRRHAASTIARALGMRDQWVRELDKIVDETERKGIGAALQRAAFVGSSYKERFSFIRVEFYAVQPPPGTESIHQQWLEWLRKLEQASTYLGHFGTQGDVALLGRATATLGEAGRLLATLTGEQG